jgi:hypothetical protein
MGHIEFSERVQINCFRYSCLSDVMNDSFVVSYNLGE